MTVENRMKFAQSPYLIRHSTNPVAWQEWDKNAHDLAKKLNKPIFLSVGYSSCHWCHVMEAESFQNPQIAAFLNANFINIKVDREERPDVDRFHMMFLTVTTRTAGWPMTVFLTPSLKPFAGFTYLPPFDNAQGQGFFTLIQHITQQFQSNPQELEAQADDILSRMKESQKSPKPVAVADYFGKSSSDRLILKCLDDTEAVFDCKFGGFGSKPKFPTPINLIFLSHTSARLMYRVREAAKKFNITAEFEDPAAGQETVKFPEEPPVPMGDRRKQPTEEDIEKSQELKAEAQEAKSSGDLAKAIQIITEAIQLNPTSGINYAVRAELFLAEKKPYSAIADCDEAIKMNPNSARPHRARGKAKMLLQQWESAALDFAKANQCDYDDDTYKLLKQLQEEKVPQAAEKRKAKEEKERQRLQVQITEGKASHCLNMMMFTLHCISHGGINDHLGGGFARYSVDEYWHVPHFEKLLCDNSLLAMAYCMAVQVDPRPQYSQSIVSTLQYILTDMQSPEGGFYCSEDADSLNTSGALEEGAFYTWTTQEVQSIVSSVPNGFEVCRRRFGLTFEGNVKPGSDPHGTMKGKNVFLLDKTCELIAQELGITLEQVDSTLSACKKLLLEARVKRSRPSKDTKIITNWNGLAISALARAYLVVGNTDYLAAARKTITFIRNKLYDDESTTLFRSFYNGQCVKSIQGFHADYAYFVQGLLDTYLGTGNPEMLRWALRLQLRAAKLFQDATNGGGFFDSIEKDDVLIRMKEDHDGAEPTPNSISAFNLWTLGNILQRSDLIDMGKSILHSLQHHMVSTPRATCGLLAALDLYTQESIQFVVTGDPMADATRAFLKPIFQKLITNKVVVFHNKQTDVFTDTEYLKEVSASTLGVKVFVNHKVFGEATTPLKLEEILVDLNLNWPKA